MIVQFVKLKNAGMMIFLWIIIVLAGIFVFTGTDGTVGFISAWESDIKNVGSGEQEILNIVEGERLGYEIRFLKPFKLTSWA